jgi:hypothetical protein
MPKQEFGHKIASPETPLFLFSKSSEVSKNSIFSTLLYLPSSCLATQLETHYELFFSLF